MKRVNLNKKFFFFDYDGTLGLPYSYDIPDSAKQALQKLEDRGHFLSLATGRLQIDSLRFLKLAGLHNAVADGGNSVTINDELKYMEPLDLESTKATIKRLHDAGYQWAVMPKNELVRYTPFKDFAEKSDYYAPTEYVPGMKLDDYETIFKVYVTVDKGEPRQKLIESGLLDGVPWCDSTINQIFLEPTNKARGIKKMIDMLGGSYKDVVVFGDGNNDISMFLPEWTCIAMGNAIPELKERATYITDSVSDNGIMNACKYFGWI